ncbi:MauE/DoxX family redox-associated membrane protein [Hellea balneolensis]|uniref:MauE/DoxX family redox-associated membrane protein n=1 Tax=Hellea balneolensis TaxID=287478 RepID=UPI00041F2A42|nr:MauE/DoxX family redox-associated membrane protein [Hellea balneolensis]
MIDPLILMPVSLGFAIFWALSGLHKLNNFQWFIQVLTGYELFPKRLIGLMAMAVPVIEISVAAALALKSSIGLFGSVALLAVYTLLLIFNTLRGHELSDCGCHWGEGSGDGGGKMKSYIYRNLLLMAAMMTMLIPTGSRHLGLLDWVNVVLALAFLSVSFLAVISLYSNFQKMKATGYV